MIVLACLLALVFQTQITARQTAFFEGGTLISLVQAERLCKSGQIREIGRELLPNARLVRVYILGSGPEVCTVLEFGPL